MSWNTVSFPISVIRYPAPYHIIVTCVLKSSMCHSGRHLNAEATRLILLRAILTNYISRCPLPPPSNQLRRIPIIAYQKTDIQNDDLLLQPVLVPVEFLVRNIQPATHSTQRLPTGRRTRLKFWNPSQHLPPFFSILDILLAADRHQPLHFAHFLLHLENRGSPQLCQVQSASKI